MHWCIYRSERKIQEIYELSSERSRLIPEPGAVVSKAVLDSLEESSAVGTQLGS